MLTSAAAVESYLAWLHTGTFKTPDPLSGDLEHLLISDAEGRKSLDESEVFQSILAAFKTDDNFFQGCLDKAIANDKPEFDYPSLACRLENLGLNPAEVRATLDINRADLVQLDELLAWLPSLRKVAN